MIATLGLLPGTWIGEVAGQVYALDSIPRSKAAADSQGFSSKLGPKPAAFRGAWKMMKRGFEKKTGTSFGSRQGPPATKPMQRHECHAKTRSGCTTLSEASTRASLTDAIEFKDDCLEQTRLPQASSRRSAGPRPMLAAVPAGPKERPMSLELSMLAAVPLAPTERPMLAAVPPGPKERPRLAAAPPGTTGSSWPATGRRSATPGAGRASPFPAGRPGVASPCPVPPGFVVDDAAATQLRPDSRASSNSAWAPCGKPHPKGRTDVAPVVASAQAYQNLKTSQQLCGAWQGKRDLPGQIQGHKPRHGWQPKPDHHGDDGHHLGDEKEQVALWRISWPAGTRWSITRKPPKWDFCRVTGPWAGRMRSGSVTIYQQFGPDGPLWTLEDQK